MITLTSWGIGLWRVVRAPGLVLMVYAVTLAVAAPFGVLVQAGLPALSPRVTPTAEDPAPPDADWLDEVSAHGTGLTSTLTPAVVGAAAPFSNLSSILDGTPPPLPVLPAVAAMFVAWILLWGGVIVRLSAPPSKSVRAAVAASWRAAPAVAAIGVAGLACYLALYVVVHAALFGPVQSWLTHGALERTAFAWRAILALLFGMGLLAVSQVLDFARIAAALNGRPAAGALADGLALVRRRPAAIAGLLVLNGGLWIGLLAAYATVEFVPGGSIPTLSRMIAVGQAFIVARVALRLVLAAAQIRLWQILPRA